MKHTALLSFDNYQTHMLQVLCAYQAWTCSTSGVEQLFSKVKRSPIENANSSADTDRRLAIVMGDTSQGQALEDLLQQGRLFYVQMLPSAQSREHKHERLDKGIAKPDTGRTQGSEAEWVRNRKAAVKAAVARKVATPQAKLGHGSLPEPLQEEIKRQQSLGQKRKAEAFRDGLLISEEATEDVKAQAARDAKTAARNDAARAKKLMKHCAEFGMTVRRPSAWAFQRLPATVWFATELEPSLKTRWTQRVLSLGVRKCTEDLNTDMFSKKKFVFNTHFYAVSWAFGTRAGPETSPAPHSQGHEHYETQGEAFC